MSKTRAQVRRGPGQRRGRTRTSQASVKEFKGVKTGMTANDLLKVPFRSSRYALYYPGQVMGKDAKGLVVRWFYPDCTITLRRRYGPEGPTPDGLQYRVSHIYPGRTVLKGREIDERVLTGEIAAEIAAGEAGSVDSSNEAKPEAGAAEAEAN